MPARLVALLHPHFEKLILEQGAQVADAPNDARGKGNLLGANQIHQVDSINVRHGCPKQQLHTHIKYAVAAHVPLQP